MNIFQVIIPFTFVVVAFVFGHFVFPASGSGIYMPEAVVELPPAITPSEMEGVDAQDIDPETKRSHFKCKIY